MDFFRKTDVLLGAESTINPWNLIKIVDAIIKKIQIFIFSSELPLILEVGENKKKMPWIFAEDTRYRIWTISVNCRNFYDCNTFFAPDVARK